MTLVVKGDLLTLLFENRVTVAGAVEEQLRAAQIEEPERTAEEVAVFNALKLKCSRSVSNASGNKRDD